MRKLDPEKSNVLRRLAVRRQQAKLRQKEKRHLKNLIASTTKDHRRELRKSIKKKAKWADIDAPPHIDLFEHRTEVCEFIKKVRDHIRADIPVRIGFHNCEAIKLSGLLYIISQIHRLRFTFGVNKLTGTYPKNEKIERLLSSTGVYELLRVKTRDLNLRPSNITRYIRFKSDQSPNSQQIPQLKNEILGTSLKMPDAIGKLIFRALSEAMINVNHHAYKTKHVDHSSWDGRWWMVASISGRYRTFNLAFYDSGVGIPKTLPRKYPIERIRSALSLLPGVNPDDGQMIRAAMQLGRSSTEESNRGKGLMDLARLIDATKSGAMTIHSRRGSYTYSPDTDGYKNTDGFVEGTLIEWQLPLSIALPSLPKEILDEIECESANFDS